MQVGTPMTLTRIKRIARESSL